MCLTILFYGFRPKNISFQEELNEISHGDIFM